MDELLSTIQSVSLTGYIVLTMAAMGMKLALPQIIETFGRRRLIIFSALVNLVAVPVVAAVALLVFELPDSAVIAVVLLAAAPGYAPIMSARSHGDLAFSTTLIFLLSSVSVVTVPLTASLLFAGQADVSVDPWSIIRTLLLFQLIPLGAGMLFRSAQEPTAERWAPLLAQAAQIAVVIAVITYLVDLIRTDDTPLLDLGWQPFVAWALISGAALVLGYLAGGPRESSRRTLSLHTVIRNVGLALLIASNSFADMGAEVAILALALVMYPIALIAMTSWKSKPVGLEATS